LSLFDELSVRISHRISKRIDLTKEAVVVLSLARLIYELGIVDLYPEAGDILEIIEKLNPSIGLNGISGDLLAVNNILEKIITDLKNNQEVKIQNNNFVLRDIKGIKKKIMVIEEIINSKSSEN